MICSAYNGLPDSISRKDFNNILNGLGQIETDETCRKKWKMMLDGGWFIPSEDGACHID